MTPGPVPIPLPEEQEHRRLPKKTQSRRETTALAQTWHLSKHVGQPAQRLSVQLHSVGYEGAFQEEVHPHPLRHGCWDENTQILKATEQSGCQRLGPDRGGRLPPTHLHCVLADLVDRLWSVVDESLAGDPVVFSQFHCVLQQEADPGRQLLVVH